MPDVGKVARHRRVPALSLTWCVSQSKTLFLFWIICEIGGLTCLVTTQVPSPLSGNRRGPWRILTLLQVQKAERFWWREMKKVRHCVGPASENKEGSINKKRSEREMRSPLLWGSIHCSAIPWGPQKLALPGEVGGLGSHRLINNPKPLMNPIMMLHNFVMLLIFSKRPHIQFLSLRLILVPWGLLGGVINPIYHTRTGRAREFIHLPSHLWSYWSWDSTRVQPECFALPDSWPKQDLWAESSLAWGWEEAQERRQRGEAFCKLSFPMTPQEGNTFLLRVF